MRMYLILAVLLFTFDAVFTETLLQTFQSLLAKNNFCSLPINLAIFHSQFNSELEIKESVLWAIHSVPIREYVETSQNYEYSVIQKATIIFAFMDIADSPLCVKLTSPFGVLTNFALNNEFIGGNELSLAKSWYRALLTDAELYGAISRFFYHERSISGFIYPSITFINSSWSFLDLSFFNSTKSIPSDHFIQAFKANMKDFVKFYCRFFNEIKPQDTKFFMVLLREIGKKPAESRFVLQLMMNSESPMMESLQLIKPKLKQIEDSNEFANKTIALLLSPKVGHYILTHLRGFDTSDSLLSFEDVSTFSINKIIDEITIKSLLANLFIKEVTSNTRSKEYNNHLTCHLLLELGSCAINVEKISEFLLDAFNYNDPNNASYVLSFFEHFKPLLSIALFQNLKSKNIADSIKRELERYFVHFNASSVHEIATNVISRLQPTEQTLKCSKVVTEQSIYSPTKIAFNFNEKAPGKLNESDRISIKRSGISSSFRHSSSFYNSHSGTNDSKQQSVDFNCKSDAYRKIERNESPRVTDGRSIGRAISMRKSESVSAWNSWRKNKKDKAFKDTMELVEFLKKYANCYE